MLNVAIKNLKTKNHLTADPKYGAVAGWQSFSNINGWPWMENCAKFC
jgi:hypothetical protein